MKSLVLLLFCSIAYAADTAPDFSKYDFTKLDPKLIEIKFPLIKIDVWDKCTQCDCPDPQLENVISTETKDAVTIRHSQQIVKEKFAVTGTQSDKVILLSKNTQDCKVDTIVIAVEQKPHAPQPCDKDCLKPAQIPADAKSDSKGCASQGASIWLFPFLFLFFKRKVFA